MSTRDDIYFRQIIDNYMSLLLRIAYSYVKNTQDAEDIVQEVLVKLVKKDPQFKTEEHERAWLIRVTINMSLDYLKACRHKELPLEENWNGVVREQSQILEEIFGLPHKYKITVYLHYIEGYSMKEIAYMLKKPQGTIGTWLARGRKLLKSSLEER